MAGFVGSRTLSAASSDRRHNCRGFDNTDHLGAYSKDLAKSAHSPPDPTPGLHSQTGTHWIVVSFRKPPRLGEGPTALRIGRFSDDRVSAISGAFRRAPTHARDRPQRRSLRSARATARGGDSNAPGLGVPAVPGYPRTCIARPPDGYASHTIRLVRAA